MVIENTDLYRYATEVIQLCKTANIRIASAESCTGGLVSAALTAIPGSSAVYLQGFVTYHNQAKIQTLNVEPALIARYGAVSEVVARQMAENALKISKADISVAITGIAGPGQSEKKPAGLVFIGFAQKNLSGKTTSKTMEYHFKGGREDVRIASALHALQMIIESFT